MGSMTFSFAVKFDMRLKDWKMKPIFFPRICANWDSSRCSMSFPLR